MLEVSYLLFCTATALCLPLPTSVASFVPIQCSTVYFNEILQLRPLVFVVLVNATVSLLQISEMLANTLFWSSTCAVRITGWH